MYDYYKKLPEKEFPDTLEEMQPLFSAVAHGCAAGLHQQVLEGVYWLRIRREEDAYIVRKLGVISDNLAVLAYFFAIPWHMPVEGFPEKYQAIVLNWAGFSLRALGRLREALEPMKAGIEMHVKQADWENAAIGANNLSELQLTLGDVVVSVVSGQQSVDYADQLKSTFRLKNMFQRLARRANYADALHQAGKTVQALEWFIEAEQIQQEYQPEHPRLYSQAGFRYCDLLLAQDEVVAVLERAEYGLELSRENGWLMDIAFNHLALGRAYCQYGDFLQATNLLDQAVAGLRKSGQEDRLPSGLLARAVLNRDIRNPNYDFICARQDLQEVFDISEPSGMRLHLTDYHLEMARLLIAEQENLPQSPVEKGESAVLSVQEHVAKAAKLIEETGYKRRLPELVALQNKLATK